MLVIDSTAKQQQRELARSLSLWPSSSDLDGLPGGSSQGAGVVLSQAAEVKELQGAAMRRAAEAQLGLQLLGVPDISSDEDALNVEAHAAQPWHTDGLLGGDLTELVWDAPAHRQQDHVRYTSSPGLPEL